MYMHVQLFTAIYARVDKHSLPPLRFNDMERASLPERNKKRKYTRSNFARVNEQLEILAL